jgi:hypothetical protein
MLAAGRVVLVLLAVGWDGRCLASAAEPDGLDTAPRQGKRRR